MKSKLRAKREVSKAARVVSLRIRKGLLGGAFDDGNGDKVLKRWLTLAAMTEASITPRDLKRIILHRPAVREKH